MSSFAVSGALVSISLPAELCSRDMLLNIGLTCRPTIDLAHFLQFGEICAIHVLLTSVLTIIFQVNLGLPAPFGFSFTCSSRETGNQWHVNLTFDDHISKVAGSCRYHIRTLRHIRRLIDRETANTLACSIVATRLDYCNSVLSGITAKNITRL